MLERKHGAFTIRQNPELIAKILRVKRYRFNDIEEAIKHGN